MLRKIIGAMAGIMVAMFIITMVENFNAKLYPLPKDVNSADREAMQLYINNLPKTAFIIMLSGYLLASFFCGLVIRLIAKSDDKTPAYLAGIGLTSAGVVNFFSYEHPWWVIITGLLIFLPLTLYGFTIIRKKS